MGIIRKFTLSLALIVLCRGFLNAAEDWNTIKSTHFIIYYKNAPAEFLSQLEDSAEDYYNKIAEELGFVRFNFWLWDNRAKIYIYDNLKEFQSATAQPPWSGGCAVVKEKLIQSFVYAQGFCQTLLPHEMAHIVFREFVGFDNRSLPLWLDEGVANYHEKLHDPLVAKSIREAQEKGDFMDLGKLNNFSSLAKINPALVQLFYTESFSVIDFLIKEYGRDSFVHFCRDLRDKKILPLALESTYHFSNLQELDQAWQEYLKKNNE